MKRLLILILGFNVTFSCFSQSKSENDSLKDIKNRIDSLKKELDKGAVKLELGLKDNYSEIKRYLEYNGLVNLNYFKFPLELNTSFSMSAIYNNKTIEQKVNELALSVDKYFTNDTNNKRIEGFAFLKRFENQYLQIAYKYETGIGVVFDIHSRKCIYNNKNIILESRDKDSIRLINANQLKFSKFRFAILFGIFSQIEQIKAERILSYKGKDSTYINSFDPTYNYKWEIRPTIVWKPNKELAIDVRCYFQFPFPPFYDTVIKDNYKNKRFNCFIDFPISLSYETSEKIGLKLEYRLFYNSSPRRIYTIVGSENNIPYYELLSAPKFYNSFIIKLTYSFTY